MAVQDEEPHNREEFDKEKKTLNNYAKYTGVAFQMMAIIGVFAFIGYKLDEYYHHATQWITALFCVLGVCLSIYQIIRQLK